MSLAHSDNIVTTPKDFHFTDTDEFISFVKIGEMKNKEIIVVVLVNFRTLVCPATVFDIKGVELIIFQKQTVIVLTWIRDVKPFYRLKLDCLNHDCTSLKFENQRSTFE